MDGQFYRQAELNDNATAASTENGGDQFTSGPLQVKIDNLDSSGQMKLSGTGNALDGVTDTRHRQGDGHGRRLRHAGRW